MSSTTAAAEPTSASSSKSRHRSFQTESGRQVGYVLIEPPDEDSEPHHRSTAIVYFYPLGFTSQFLEELFPLDSNNKAYYYNCSIVCVDRPGYRGTSALQELEKDEGKSAEKEDDETVESEEEDESEATDEFLHRIDGHVDDVLQVLQHEKITTINVLGVCLGHPFAVQLCRRVMSMNTAGKPIKLQGLTLVAPFVSPACPVSWNMARLGAFVPNLLLRAGTYVGTGIGDVVLYLALLGTMSLKKTCCGSSVEKKDQNQWVRILKIVQEMGNSSTTSARALEARLGVAKTWQSPICDKFAVESGCGLVIVDSDHAVTKPSECKFPLVIHASPEDMLVPHDAVKWISKRCYGGTKHLVTHKDLKSHEAMTVLFGGGLDNPYLLRTIARDWGLLLSLDDDDGDDDDDWESISEINIGTPKVPEKLLGVHPILLVLVFLLPMPLVLNPSFWPEHLFSLAFAVSVVFISASFLGLHLVQQQQQPCQRIATHKKAQ